MISGSIVALITPMFPDGEIDWIALDKLVDWHVAEGTDAIVAVGTSGESPTLSVAEHLQVIDAVVKKAEGRLPVIAGTGSNCTREAIDMTREAKALGADASLQVVPYYNKPTQEGLYGHFSAIADAVELPVVLYNVPSRTITDLEPETVGRLADHANIIGIKEATGDLDRGRQVLEICGDKLWVYSGDDVTACELMLMGAKGDISVTANVAPAQMSRLCKVAIEGDADSARDIDNGLQPLHQSLFVQANPIPVKWAVHQLGLCDRGIRLPLTELQDTYRSQLKRIIEELKL